MDIVEFRDFCLSLPFAEECTPFDEDTLVFKIGGRMFAFTSISDFSWVGIKCEPEKVTEFSDLYSYIRPAYHMSKKHWINIMMDQRPPHSFVCERVRESYRLVIAKMPKKDRDALTGMILETGYGYL